MKNEGKRFEEDFEKSLPKHWACVRLKDAAGWATSEQTRFTVSNICDLIIFNGENMFLAELKSTITGRVPKTKKILQQLESLLEYVGKKNTYPVFIMNYRKEEETYLIDARYINACFQGRCSIPIAFCREYGLLIPQQLKRTRYKYLVEDVEWKYI